MFPKEFFPDQREQVNLSPKKKLVNQTALTPVRVAQTLTQTVIQKRVTWGENLTYC